MDGGELRQLRIGTGRDGTKRAHTLRNRVGRGPKFAILLLEHRMELREARARHVPVIVVCLEIKRVVVGQYTRQTFRDSRPVLLGNTHINCHMESPFDTLTLGNGAAYRK